MKKLTLSLVFLFVCGMVGEAGAALITYTETYLGTALNDGSNITLNGKKNVASDYATFAFNLVGIGGDATKNGTTINGALTGGDSTTFIPISDPEIIQSAVLKIYYSNTQNAAYKIELFDMVNGIVASNPLIPAITTYLSGSDIDLKDHKSALTDGSIFVKFTNTNNNGNSSKNIILDQVQLNVTTPLPSAAWLLGAGLIGLIGVRRKVVS